MDTNVLVSSLMLPDSLPGQVVARWEAGDFEMVVSPRLLGEFQRVLARPWIHGRVPGGEDTARRLANLINSEAVRVQPGSIPTAVPGDPDDDHVLAAAVAGGADYVVTGDTALLALERHEAAQIVTPRRFLAVLAGAGA